MDNAINLFPIFFGYLNTGLRKNFLHLFMPKIAGQIFTLFKVLYGVIYLLARTRNVITERTKMSSNKMSPEDVESLFKYAYTTMFCSHNKDGTIHAAPIWYNYRDGEFYFVSIKKSRRVANLKRNNIVSLAFMEASFKSELFSMKRTTPLVISSISP